MIINIKTIFELNRRMTSPLSDSLKLLEHFKFEHGDINGLKSTVTDGLSAFLRDNSTKQQKFDSAKPFPKPYVFAKFSSLVYHDSENSDQLPKGWKVLISSKSKDGYFGRAYWPFRINVFPELECLTWSRKCSAKRE